MQAEIVTIDYGRGKRLFIICGNNLAVNVPEKQKDEYLKAVQTGRVFRKKATAVYKLNAAFSMSFDHESTTLGFSDSKKNLILYEIHGTCAKLIWDWIGEHLRQRGYCPGQRKKSTWFIVRGAVIVILIIAALLAYLLWLNADPRPLNEMSRKIRALASLTHLFGPTGLYILAGLSAIGFVIYAVQQAIKGLWQTVYRKENRPVAYKETFNAE